MTDVHDDPTPRDSGDPATRHGDPGAPAGAGSRRLARPPSDRYRRAAADAAPEPGSEARGLAYGVVAAVAGATAITVLGGALAISAGLLVVALAIGYAVAVVLKLGAGASVSPRTRRWSASGLTAAGIVLGQVGLWLYGRTEGGVLSLPDYLVQVFGVLVPLQLALGVAAAWWSRR